MSESQEAGQKVLVQSESDRRTRLGAPAPEAAWRWVGWLGLVLWMVGAGDVLMAWYPLAFGRPEWEFATVAQSMAGLPLVTMGWAGVLGAGLASGRRWLLLAVGATLAIGALCVVLSLGLFLTVVPIALRAAEGLAAVGVKKAIVKTLFLGLVFGVGYAAAAVAALRQARAASREVGTHA